MARMIVPPQPAKVVNNYTMTATTTSTVIDTAQCDAVSWEIICTGTPTGTFTIEASNQYDPNSNATPTFIAMPATTPALSNPAGAGSSQLVTSPGLAAGGGAGRFQRLRYAFTGGTGTLNVWAVGVGRA